MSNTTFRVGHVDPKLEKNHPEVVDLIRRRMQMAGNSVNDYTYTVDPESGEVLAHPKDQELDIS